MDPYVSLDRPELIGDANPEYDVSSGTVDVSSRTRYVSRECKLISTTEIRQRWSLTIKLKRGLRAQGSFDCIRRYTTRQLQL